jgi:hypothetical protein
MFTREDGVIMLAKYQGDREIEQLSNNLDPEAYFHKLGDIDPFEHLKH